ncbi:MAG: tetratricopeptide repeat protein [Planctomycetota bacterium]
MPHPISAEVRTITVLAGEVLIGTRPEVEPTPLAPPGLASRLKEIIEAAGGRLELGPTPDFAAVFGTAHTNDEDPVRAVRAALAIQREAASLSAVVRGPLAFRIGVHTGEIPWSGPGAGRTEGLRESLSVARLLAHAAHAGAVLVSEGIMRAAAARFRFKPSPAGEGTAYEAVGEVETRREPREELATTTVGREAELARLMEAFDAKAGEFVLIEGDAGVGKSRLLYEFHRRLIERNVPVLVAFGRAYEGPPIPLSAIGDLVRHAAGVTGLEPGDGERLAAWFSEQLEESIPDAIDRENCSHLITLSLGLALPPTRVAQIEPGRVRSETHYAWLRWLRALVARQAVVLCLEDLHWADDGTLALLESLAAGISGERVTIVGTRRPAAKTPRGCTRVRLEELPREATAKLAEEIFHGPVSDELAEFLFQQSGGHPYFYEELSRYLVEAGLVSGTPLQLVSRPRKLPDGLHGLLVARIDSMGHDDREVLKAASVFGRFFWSGLLEQAVYGKVEKGLERARRRQIVVPRARSLIPGDHEYAFRHDLLRDAAYSLLTAREKSRLHRVVADLLEPHIASGGRRIRALVAVHREAAGKKEEPARLWLEAAEEALRESAYSEALSHARDAQRLGRGPAARLVAARALVRLARLDDALIEATAVAGSPDASAEESASARLLEGEIHGRRGDREAFLAIVEKVAAANPPGFVLPEALMQKARVLWGMSRNEEALKCVEEVRARTKALATAANERQVAKLTADSWGIEGNVRWKQRRWPEAAAAYDRVLEIATRLGDRLATASVFNSVGALHRDQGKDTEARAAFERALGILREIGDRIGIASALGNLGLVYRESGDLQASATAQRESLAIFRQTGDLHAVARGLKALSDALLDGGELAAALGHLDEALELARRIGDRSAEMLALRNLGQVHAVLGDEARALDELTQAFEMARAEGNPFNMAFIQTRLGELHADAGFPEKAAAALDTAIRVASERTLDDVLTLALLARARLQASTRGVEAAADARRALEISVRKRNEGHEASVRAVLARIAAASGDSGQAHDFLGKAHDMAGRCVVFQERLRFLADLSAAHAAMGEVDEARQAAGEGERLARGHGAVRFAERFVAPGK